MDRLAEREQLKKFLEDLEGVLDWTITNFDSLAPTPTPDADVRRALVVAWDEFRESERRSPLPGCSDNHPAGPGHAHACAA